MEPYMLTPSGHAAPRPSNFRTLPNASARDVASFAEKFRAACGYPTLSDEKAAFQFYSKVRFLCDTNNTRIISMLFPDLLCESCLLFEQDFNYLSDNSFEAFWQNKPFFEQHPPKDISKLDYAAQKVEAQYDLQHRHPAISAALWDQVQIARVQHSSRKQLVCDSDTLSEPEKSFYEDIIWHSFIMHLLWLDDEPKRYRRQITTSHRLQFDQYQANRAALDRAGAEYQQWLTVSRPIELRCRPDEQQYTAFLSRLPLSDSSKVLHRIENEMQDFNSFYQIVCDSLGLSPKCTPPMQLEKVRLLCTMISEFSPSAEEIQLVCRSLWRSICGRKAVPPLRFFRLLQEQCELSQLQNLPPLYYGVLICNLLDTCLPDMQESLSHENLYLMRQGVVGRFKELYPDNYRSCLSATAQNKNRISEYADLWSDYAIGLDCRRDYLKRRIRHIHFIIPDDDRLWEGIPSIQAASSANRVQRVKKCQDALALLIFENALQDCVREQAKEHLWECAWVRNFQK